MAAGNFELQILEISNTNNHLLTGYCCGVELEARKTQTKGNYIKFKETRKKSVGQLILPSGRHFSFI